MLWLCSIISFWVRCHSAGCIGRGPKHLGQSLVLGRGETSLWPRIRERGLAESESGTVCILKSATLFGQSFWWSATYGRGLHGRSPCHRQTSRWALVLCWPRPCIFHPRLMRFSFWYCLPCTHLNLAGEAAPGATICEVTLEASVPQPLTHLLSPPFSRDLFFDLLLLARDMVEEKEAQYAPDASSHAS